MARRVFWNGLKYVVAFGLLGYVVYANWDPPSGGGLRDAWQAHVVDRQPVNATALVLAFALFAFSLLVTLVRWHLLMRAQDLPVAWPATLRIGLLGYFFNTFLPGSVGGDLVKAAAVAREQHRRAVAVATVIMDRLLGLWSMISFAALVGGLFALAGMLEGPAAAPARAIVLSTAGVAGSAVLAWILVGLLIHRGTEWMTGCLRRIPRVGGVLVEFWYVLRMYRSRQGSVVLAIGLSWLSNAAYALAFYCGALTLCDGDVARPLPTLAEHCLLVPLGCVIGAIPLFPGGAGINEAGFGGLYALFGSAASSGILAALVSRFVSWIIGLAGYLVCQCMQFRAQPGPLAVGIAESAGSVARVEQARCDSPA